jgi:uncharacterized protein YndB with AHSA1/START domain
MTVTAVDRDATALSLTLTAEFAATPERVWRLWEDPRQLERWWGPPAYPATFTAHDLRTGGHMEYHLTGPMGDQPHAFWEILEVDPPRRIVLSNGLAHADGTPDPAFPRTTMRVTFHPVGQGRTQMQLLTTFPSKEAMEQLVAMGMVEGLSEAVGQIDAILEEVAVR